MALSPEEVQALTDAVSQWRLQENIMIPFDTFYLYYVLTTIHEDVSIILPQRWSRGKMLYLFIRYGFVVFIALQLSSDYRNYFTISPMACKVLMVIYDATRWLVLLACDASLGLCLSALLQLRKLYLVGLVLLCVAVPFASFIFAIGSDIQYPPEPISSLDEELGYPCYAPSTEDWGAVTIIYVGQDIRAYVNLATTLLLVIIGFVALVVRYKGQNGQLIRVITRDGGLYYIAILVLRFVTSIIYTPALVSLNTLNSNPAYMLFYMTNDVIRPVLAQRLMINMRKVDYMGSQPFASKLLFAPPQSDSDDDLAEELSRSLDMSEDSSGLHQRTVTGTASPVDETGNTTSHPWGEDMCISKV